MTTKYLKYILFAGGFLIMGQSCKLDARVYDQIRPENFFENQDQITAFTSSGYANVAGYFGTMVLEVGVTSDELSNALRSNDGWPTNDDQMAQDFKPSEGYISGAWDNAFGGVGTCNRLIEFLQNLKSDQKAAIAELRALRAFYLWTALDLFGNIPVELHFADANPTPSQITAPEAYAIIEKELLESIPDLNPDKSQATYAKVNQGTAYMLLANLYINAERYGVPAKWTEAANAALAVINSGHYSLSPGYFSNFIIKNEASMENIFVIPFDRNQIVNNIVHQSLHQSAGATFGLAAQPWGGYSVKSDFYNSFDTDDHRRGMFIVGQQYTKEAGPIWDATLGFKYSNPQTDFKLFNCSEDYNVLSNTERQFWGLPTLAPGQSVSDLPADQQQTACNIFIDPSPTPILRTLSGRAEDMIKYRDEAKIGKFEIEVGTNVPTGSNNDFPIFRYGEALLLRAEALWRLDNGSSEALNLVNQIRDRAGLQPLAQLTADNFYHEIRHEYGLEGKSRPVMIRFGHWEDEWNWKYVDPSKPGDPYVSGLYKRVFPIPETALSSNSKLVQNSGY